MVRELFRQIGLDEAAFGTPRWNPLGSYIAPGSRVFVLCNFVYHRRPSESADDFMAKCVHGSVVRAVVDYVLAAVGPAGSVRIGNAPLQSCNWDSVLRDSHAAEVGEFYAKHGAPVAFEDLRMHVSEMSPAGRLRVTQSKGDGGDVVEVDLRSESLLAETEFEAGKFRVSDYDPSRTESCHLGTSHRYLLHRSILESDVVVSLSKLKTHNKVGVTCGLKGFVGAVAHKDCLAHHRVGSPATGGDEFPNAFRYLAPLSKLSDVAYNTHSWWSGPLQVADRTGKRALRVLGATMAGSWDGNDTAWRMALDLGRILHYADAAGAMCDAPQRVHLSIIDGVVGGEGDGPLAPRAVPSASLLFADDVAVGDRTACRLMGFASDRVRLIERATAPMTYRISTADAPLQVRYNGERRAEECIPPVLGRPFRPPRGWESIARQAPW